MRFLSRARSVGASSHRRQPVDSPFDGPLGSFLDVVVRFEDGLSRMLAPLARPAQAPGLGGADGSQG